MGFMLVLQPLGMAASTECGALIRLSSLCRSKCILTSGSDEASKCQPGDCRERLLGAVVSLRTTFRYKLVSVTAPNEESRSVLSSLADSLQLDVWRDATGFGTPALVLLKPQAAAEFFETASKKGLAVSTNSQDLQELLDNERKEVHFATYSKTSDRFERYLTYDEFKDALQQYAKEYDHVTYTSIGRSYEGRDIIGVHIKAKENLPIVFLECGIHAREWIVHATCLYIIDQLATHYGKKGDISRLLSTYEWRIYPIVNPDGYEYSHTTDRLWRKNRSHSRFSECIGADVNRNFDIGQYCTGRSSTDPCEPSYCGDEPFSEPESRAVRDALGATRGRTEFYFTLHNFGLLWMFAYAHRTQKVPEHDELMNISARASEAMKKIRGNEFDYGPISTTLYRSSGHSVDWAYENGGVKKAFIVELEPSWRTTNPNKGFVLPVREILSTVKEAWVGIKAAVAP
ncbi:zinc carboxypeptidase-like isoform X2 [Dermacentor albipictus]|uniref:zinc carboxypeptidase-like isoform X2 n=1 Tax=Dermacentor albipictus TaxID=60249 RepID=UPI0038FC5369